MTTCILHLNTNTQMRSINTILACILGHLSFTQPNMEWVNSVGGVSSENVTDICSNSNDELLITGSFSETVDFNSGMGSASLTAGVNAMDGYLVKYDQDGNFIWVLGFQGTDSIRPASIDTDNSGAIYITGSFSGTVDFDPSTSVYNLSSGGSSDIFICKLSSSGGFLWAQAIGNTQNDYGSGVAIDNLANVNITGMITNSSENILLMQLDSTGVLNWQKDIGGPLNDRSNAIAVDQNNNIFIAGTFRDTVQFEPGNSSWLSQRTAIGDHDGFLASYSVSGQLSQCFQHNGLNSSSSCEGISLQVLNDNTLFLGGDFTGDVNFDLSTPSATVTAAGLSDLFQLTYSVDPFYFLNGIKLGGTGDDHCGHVTGDGGGDVQITGSFEGTVDFDQSFDTYSLISSGASDAFLVRYNDLYELIWAISVGDAGNDEGIAMHYSNNMIYLAGNYENSVDFDPDSTVLDQVTSNGSSDVFLQKFFACTIDTSITMLSDTKLKANAVNIDYQWVDCNNNYAEVPFHTGQLFFPYINSSYAVILTDGACVDTSNCYIIDNLSLDETELIIKVYPNPTSDVLHISGIESGVNQPIFISDLIGNVVEELTLTGNTVDVSRFESGAYLIQIDDQVIRFVKQ